MMDKHIAHPTGSAPLETMRRKLVGFMGECELPAR